MCDTFDKELSKSNTQMAYAKVGAEVVGYVVFVRDGDVGKIIKLCVAPHQRRRGVGATLFDMALSVLGVPPQAAGGWCVAGGTDDGEDPRDLCGERTDEAAMCEGVDAMHVTPAHQGARGAEGRDGSGAGGKAQGAKRKKGGGGSSKAPEANPPALVQLQVDPERTGALRLYQSRGFAEVPAHVCCACMPR